MLFTQTDMNEWTTIRVYKKTRDRLINLGRKQETFDSVINSIIDHIDAEEYRKTRKKS